LISLQRNDRTSARKHLRTCEEFAPRLEYAFVLFDDGEREHALHIAEELAIAFAEEPRAHSSLAEMHLTQGNLHSAISSLQRALSVLFGVRDWLVFMLARNRT
jgi:Flp pilus assembly protein TadD